MVANRNAIGAWETFGLIGPRTFYVNEGEKIQNAVDKAWMGDTIIVESGTYDENVVLIKKLTLIGWGNPTINGNKIGNAITLYADGVYLAGFNTVNSFAGIFVRSNNNIVTRNSASNNDQGIVLGSSNNNQIIGNIANNNDYGILLGSSDNNQIIGNNANDNGDGSGIGLWQSHNNLVTGNIATSNSFSGIILDSCNSNDIVGNSISYNNANGIELYKSNDNNVLENNIANNVKNGIGVSTCENNKIMMNNVLNNKYLGILTSYSANDVIYLNNFVNNAPMNGYSDSPLETWVSPLAINYAYNGESWSGYLGNYWSDYSGTSNERGVGITPYSNLGMPSAGKDYYPIVKQFENYVLT